MCVGTIIDRYIGNNNSKGPQGRGLVAFVYLFYLITKKQSKNMLYGKTKLIWFNFTMHINAYFEIFILIAIKAYFLNVILFYVYFNKLGNNQVIVQPNHKKINNF